MLRDHGAGLPPSGAVTAVGLVMSLFLGARIASHEPWRGLLARPGTHRVLAMVNGTASVVCLVALPGSRGLAAGIPLALVATVSVVTLVRSRAARRGPTTPGSSAPPGGSVGPGARAE